MTISFTSLIVWLVIAALVGLVGEFIARRRTSDGLLGATILGFLAIFLIVGVLRFSIVGEPTIAGVPLISSIIAAAILVFIWSRFAYHRIRPYYRRGGHIRRWRRRWWR